jgi:creatinine amidohydrolase
MKKPLRTRRIDELNWQEFSRLVPKCADLALLPVGTVEAHGVTGLGTDNQIPESIARRIAGKVNALVAPTVPYGITRSLLPYPGSLAVSPATFERYVFEVAAGLADAGFRRVVILNGHGGNTDALRNVSTQLYREKKVFSLVIDWWVLCDPEVRQVCGHAGGHAGTDETALVMADHPADVRKEHYRKDMAFLARPGLIATPLPGSVILYEPDQGYPEFNSALADKLMSTVCARVADTILDILARWRRVRG